MFKNNKVIVVSPAGRKQFLEILSHYMLRDRHVVDEWHLWFNTPKKEDTEYIKDLQSKHPDYIKVIYNHRLPNQVEHTCGVLSLFYRYCIDFNTVYIKADDDIAFVHKDAIQELVNYKLNHPEYFLVYANTLVNVVGNYVQQRLGNLTTEFGICTTSPACPVAWRSSELAEYAHETLIQKYHEGSLCDLMYREYILFSRERMSINFCCWSGSDLWAAGNESPTNDEETLSRSIPFRLNKFNAICGTSLVAHFAYMAHRHVMSRQDLIQKYLEIAKMEYQADQ